MGILMKPLLIGKFYWVTDLTTTIPLKVEKLRLTEMVSYTQNKKKVDYKFTYKFGKYEVDVFSTDTKFGMMTIGNNHITNGMVKMLEILNNHITMDYNKKQQDNILDYTMIRDYISDINTNHPELLI